MLVSPMDLDDEPRIDAKSFQEPLWKLAEVMAQKVMRERSECMPTFVCEDIHVMIRQAIATYNLLFYLNADDRRENDCYWNEKHGVVTAPLVRSMIDCVRLRWIAGNPYTAWARSVRVRSPCGQSVSEAVAAD